MKRIILIITIIVLGIHVSAQIPDAAKSMLSPNAAALGEYGDVPVSYFTGIPNIEIPLYTLQCGSHSLPISLSYHAGGVRPDQRPGWTGLGWTLNAGGCISRIVKDMPDEFRINNSWDKCCYNAGFLYRYSILNNANWDNAWQMHAEYYSEKNYFISHMGSNVAECPYSDWDTEPDEFSFNFLNYHGKFWLNDQGQWQVQCDKNVNIRLLGTNMDPYGTIENGGIPNSYNMTSNANGYSKAIEGFELITEDGTKYLFGGCNSAIEYSMSFFSQKKEDVQATSWYLRNITFTDGRSITLNYSPPSRGNMGSKGVFIAQFGINTKNVTRISASGGTNTLEEPRPIDSLFIYQGMLIRPVYLTSITTDVDSLVFDKECIQELDYDLTKICKGYTQNANGNISDFLPLLYANSFDVEANSNGKEESIYPDKFTGEIRYGALQSSKLSAIILYDKNNNSSFVKYWDFTYNDKYDERLMLMNVKESGVRGAYGKKYCFDYCHPERLPKYLANATDHWGFFNNRTVVGSNFNYANLRNYGLLKRTAEFSDSCRYYGMLTKITYPTGGFTNLYFEPNYCGKKIDSNRQVITCDSNLLVGGLRIRKIESFSETTSAPTTIEYDYSLENCDISSGLLTTQNKYFFENYTPNDINMNPLSMDIFSTQSVIPGTENSCGSHIGYSTVTEIFSDGSKNIYNYTNYDSPMCNDLMAESVTQENREECEPFSSRSFMRGLLVSKKEYNSGNQLTSRTNIEYEIDDTTRNNFVKSFKYDITPYPDAQQPVLYMTEAACYKNFTYLPRKKSEQTVSFDPINSKDSLVTYTEYNYNNNKFIQSILRQTSGNTLETTTMNYVSDNPILYPNYHSKHILSPITEQIVTKASNESNQVTSKLKSTYNDTISQPIAVEKTKGAFAYEQRNSYTYDDLHNVIEEIVDNSKHTVYLWGYNAQYIVAVIENATLDEVMHELQISDITRYTQFEKSVSPDFNAIEGLRSALSNAMVTTYKYLPLVGVTESTAPNGLKHYYGYDAFGRLQYIKDHDGNIIEAYNYHYKN